MTEEQLLAVHKGSLDELEQSAIDIGEEFIVSKELYILELDKIELLNVLQFEENNNYKHYNLELGCIKYYTLQEINIFDNNNNKSNNNKYKLQSGDIIRRMNRIIYFDINLKISYWKVEILKTMNDSNIENMKGFIATQNSCLYQRIPSKCLRILYIIWNYLTSYSMLISIFTDILLMIEIYSTSDYRFLFLSILFTLIPLSFISFIICIISSSSAKLPKLPILNIPIYLTKSTNSDASSAISLFLSLFMTFPLYIINISYMLEKINNYIDISIYNILQLSASLITLCIAPYFNLIQFISDSYINNGLLLTFSDKIKIYSSICGICIPMTIIEVIHFFPLLFSYYIDKTISLRQLYILLLIFNIPKLIFVFHIIKQIFPENSINHCYDRFGKLLILCCFMILPLILYSIIWLFRDVETLKPQCHKNKTIKIDEFWGKGWCSTNTIYFWNIVLYINMSYILTAIFISWNQHFHFVTQISYPVTISIILVVILSIFITLTLPIFYQKVKMYINHLRDI